MKGLVWKDIYLMRSLGRSYLLILAVFTVLTFTGIYDATFTASFLSLLCIMIPVNIFAYDEQAKWDKYAAALPPGRAGVVQARYIFTLIVGLAALALVVAIQTILFFLRRPEETTLIDVLFSGLLPDAFGILMNAILLPLLFKFGAQKGRMYLMVAVGCCVGAVFGGLAILNDTSFQVGAILLPLSLIPILCFLSLIPSYVISLHIYQKKDL